MTLSVTNANVGRMPNFDFRVLSVKDGSWDQFIADWNEQCTVVGEAFDDYSPDTMAVIAQAASRELLAVGGLNITRVGALWDEETSRFYACCMLNKTTLPGTKGWTLRVRHLLVSPLLDYGVAEVAMYPDVVVGVLQGIIHASSTVLASDNVHLHLRSPEDMAFFRSFGMALDGEQIFESVQTRGAWLYITKAASGVSTEAEEQQ